MTTENKKYLIYGGVAFLVGSLGYFVYTTLKNKNSVAQTSEQLNSNDEEVKNNSGSNFFRDLLDDSDIPTEIDYKFNPTPFTPKGFFY